MAGVAFSDMCCNVAESLAVSMGEAAKPSLGKVLLNVSGFAVSMGEATKP